MATYLQGVTDYIPQFQPFQPDLNFYANALQTKQTQYDSNYKALNNVYGQYFYADLTHGDNVKKKDELLKAIDFNLKRVSGLDLSLEQNVEQATQVFKPFYQDKHLMKDMAWTKNTNSERNYAAGLKNARDEKQRAQYWDAGIRAIDYKTEEFKNASLDETMNIGNVSYTPYVNVMEKAQKIAKDAGLSVETVNMSPDGKWIVKNKNGEQLIPQLSHLFEATLGADPAVMDVYSTQAYVNRKDYAYSNAAQFGGDQNAAEMKYLSESYNMLKAENEARQAELEKTNAVYNKKASKVEKAVAENKATPDTASYLERLNEARNINSKLLSSTQEHVSALSNDNGTATTSSGFENPYGDIESLRWKVDNAMASKLMQKDLYEAANVFAYKDAKQDMTANPYAVQAEAHAYRMQEQAFAAANREKLFKMKIANEMDKAAPAQEGYEWDKDPNSPTFGRAIPKEDGDEYFTETTAEGSSTDIVNLRDVSSSQTDRFIDKNVVPYLKNMLVTMQDLKGELDQDDMQTIFGDKNMTIEKFNSQLNSDPYKFIKGTLGISKLKKITSGFQKVIAQNYNVGNDAFTEAGNKMKGYTTSLDDFYRHANELEKWKTESRDIVLKHVEERVDNNLKGYVSKMFDANGRQLTKEEFVKKYPQGMEIGPFNRGEWIKIGGKDVYATSKNIDKLITQAGENELNNGTYTGESLIEYRNRDKDNNWLSFTRQTTDKSKLEPGKEYFKLDGKYVEITPSNRKWLVEKAGKQKLFNPFGQLPYVDTAKSSGAIYDKLKEAIHNGYTTAPIKNTPPGIEAIGDVKDSGLTNLRRQSIKVYTNIPESRGAANFNEIKRNINEIGFDNIDIAYEGPTKSSKTFNKNTGRAFIQAIFDEASKPKSILNGFKISAQAIAQNNANKGAIIIYPNAEFLKKYTYTIDSEGKKKGVGLISEDEANYVLNNGVSLVTDKKNWNNSLFESTYVTPLEASVNYSKEVKIQDPNDMSGMNFITLSKDDIMGGYKYDFGYKVWDPINKVYSAAVVPGRGVTSGAELEQRRQQAFSYWQQTLEINNENFQSNQ